MGGHHSEAGSASTKSASSFAEEDEGTCPGTALRFCSEAFRQLESCRHQMAHSDGESSPQTHKSHLTKCSTHSREATNTLGCKGMSPS